MLIALLFPFSVHAQVQVRPLPEAGYDQRIRDFVNQLRVVDTHEHLMTLEILKKIGRYTCTTPDFMLLLNVYASEDIKSAGMQDESFKKLMTDGMTVMEKWQAIKPYWEASSNTAYNRGVLLVADQLFGVKNIDYSTVEELSEKIRKAYQDQPGWFYHILREKCGIEYVVLNPWWDDRSFYDPKLFKYAAFINTFVSISSKRDIGNFSRWKSAGVNTLDDLVSAVGMAFHATMNEGVVAVKISLAYSRPLFFADVKKEEADAVFNKLKNSPGETGFSFDEVKPLQDYMMHRILDMAKANNIPVQIHTGLQANTNDGNIIENANPALMANLFQEYPDVKFILFHGGYPFGGEVATLAKNFRNVYIDLCWLYIISPSYSERYLHEWLETVPASKIMAFGGDHFNVEGVYSDLIFAKRVISNVLIDKVKDGYFTEDEAINIARMILHDNAVRILNLK
jgi:predicted TIM-barrel fold metal-dependent hydrolase